MKDKYVVITGATGGIGSQLSKLCIENIDNIEGCLVYKDQKKFDIKFKDIILEKIDTCQMNFREINTIDINSVLEKRKFKTIVLVLTAFTINPIEKIINQEIDQIVENIYTNIISQINLILEILKYIKENNVELRIVNINSGAAYHPISGWSLYSSSKSYMNAYLKSLQLEEKLKIVSFDPGVVDTAMQEIIRSKDKVEYDFVDTFTKFKINGELNSPHEVASYIWKQYIEEWHAIKFEERFVR